MTLRIQRLVDRPDAGLLPERADAGLPSATRARLVLAGGALAA
jgi:hypothetical protein